MTVNPCVLAFAILLEMPSHLLSKARSHTSIVYQHRCSGDCAGAGTGIKPARESLLHPHRRCAPCHMINSQNMWNGADKQAGIEVAAFSIVVSLAEEHMEIARG